MILVPAVCDRVDVPVVAAGGIADRRGFGRRGYADVRQPGAGGTLGFPCGPTREYNLRNAYKAWFTGDFDLFPAGAGQVSALIKAVRPIKDIIVEMVS
jgi:enoyl-[acyl-carrier protein] reductase II